MCVGGRFVCSKSAACSLCFSMRRCSSEVTTFHSLDLCVVVFSTARGLARPFDVALRVPVFLLLPLLDLGSCNSGRVCCPLPRNTPAPATVGLRTRLKCRVACFLRSSSTLLPRAAGEEDGFFVGLLRVPPLPLLLVGLLLLLLLLLLFPVPLLTSGGTESLGIVGFRLTRRILFMVISVLFFFSLSLYTNLASVVLPLSNGCCMLV